MSIFLKIIAFLLLIFSFFILYDRYDMRQPIAFEALQQIDPLPKTRTLIQAGKLVDAQEYLTFFMPYPYMKNNLEAKTLYSISNSNALVLLTKKTKSSRVSSAGKVTNLRDKYLLE